MRRALCSVILALVLSAPVAVAAQTAPAAQPDSLATLTNSYFDAILHADVSTLSGMITGTFHEIEPNGKRLSFEDFMREVSSTYFVAMPPMGTTQTIGTTTITPTGATESVDSLRWFWGAANPDPESGPLTERQRSTHQLTWLKSSTGRWLLDEDHVTSAHLQ